MMTYGLYKMTLKAPPESGYLLYESSCQIQLYPWGLLNSLIMQSQLEFSIPIIPEQYFFFSSEVVRIISVDDGEIALFEPCNIRISRIS